MRIITRWLKENVPTVYKAIFPKSIDEEAHNKVLKTEYEKCTKIHKMTQHELEMYLGFYVGGVAYVLLFFKHYTKGVALAFARRLASKFCRLQARIKATEAAISICKIEVKSPLGKKYFKKLRYWQEIHQKLLEERELYKRKVQIDVKKPIKK